MSTVHLGAFAHIFPSPLGIVRAGYPRPIGSKVVFELFRQVFDVVWSDADKRTKGANGKLTPVGDTVNIAKASYTNSIGDPELRTIWTDPEFNPSIRAFYYVRVIEIPTPRWVLFDALRYGAKLLPGTQLKAQERAYSSPIWFNPKKS